MKKFFAKASISLAVLLGILFLFLCFEHFRGKRALHARLAELAAQGEKLNIADLLPPPLPPEQNAALDLFALTNEVQSLKDILTSAPPSIKIPSPGRAIATWQWSFWPVSDKQSNTWAQFETEIQPARPTLDKLQSIWHKAGSDDSYNYSNSFIDYVIPPLLVKWKQIALLLSSTIATDLHKNDLSAATAHIHSLLALANTIHSQQEVISQLVRIACIRIAFDATWSALQKPGWTDAQLSELQTAWQLNDAPTDMLRACRMERNMTLVFHDRVRESKAALTKALGAREQTQSLFGDEESSLATSGMILHYVHIPIWRFAWASQDELRALNRWQDIITASQKAATNSWCEAESLFPQATWQLFAEVDHGSGGQKLGWYDRCRFLFSSDTFSVSGIIMRKALQVQTEQNMVLTVIALKRHELRHGKPAHSLLDLVPEFLPTIPVDCMDGKSLRYRLENDGSFKLYSVGTNGKDENGNPEPQEAGTHSNDLWKGKDMVWPVLASESEAIEYQRKPPGKQ
jgi:hypothetical protein